MTEQFSMVRALHSLGDGVEVRLARTPSEIEAVQRLRYRVFYEEMGARACRQTLASGLDRDRFDDACDHLVAIAGDQIVGTYRFIRRAAAERCGGFYSAAEFDIAPLLRQPGEILELGRSCIDPQWRLRGTLQLLWQGIADYILRHRVGLLFGCASLPGTDVARLAPQLAYLRDHHLAPPQLRTQPLPERGVRTAAIAAYDPARALRTLPPLIKGYLRAGCQIGDGAVVDRQFNTTDVLIVLDTRQIAERYQDRYLREDLAAG